MRIPEGNKEGYEAGSAMNSATCVDVCCSITTADNNVASTTM